MKSYTVLISNFHRHGGGQRVYVHILGKYLLQSGHHPLVACPRGSKLASECARDGIEVLDGFRFDGGFTPISFCRDVAVTKRVRAEKQIDLIHVNGSRDHWVMAIANLLSPEKLPLVRTRHNTNPVRNNFISKLLYRNLTSQTISVCHYVKEMLSQSPVFENCGIAVIHNGLELERFTPMPPDARVREEFGISAKNLVIGIIGRLDWDKGHKYLLEAASPLIKGEFPNIKILVVGFGKERRSLERLSERLNISSHVVFAGQRNDIKEVISTFEIGVQPSIGVDTSSYAMKEMMAMEKPVVCSSYGGLKEIAEDGITGYVVPPRDSDTLRDRIAELCRSKELRERLGKEARGKVEREFTSTASVQKTLEVYEQTVENFERIRKDKP